MLNKKGLFERALLVNFVAMVACASSMVVASDNTQTEKQNQNKQSKQTNKTICRARKNRRHYECKKSAKPNVLAY